MDMEVFELNRKISMWLRWSIRCLLLIVFAGCSYLYLFDHPTWMQILYGTRDLGNNFYSMSWDGGHYIVVYNNNVQNDEVFSGMRVIDDTHIVVTDIEYNNRWIAMTTFNYENNTNSWYILDKYCIPSENLSIDSIRFHISKGLIPYFSKESFECAMQEKKINFR